MPQMSSSHCLSEDTWCWHLISDDSGFDQLVNSMSTNFLHYNRIDSSLSIKLVRDTLMLCKFPVMLPKGISHRTFAH